MRALKIVVMVAAVVAIAGPHAPESPFCAGALHAQQQPPRPPMPPPGNPGHEKPHKDAYCDRSKSVAHSCQCHAKCVEGEDGKIQIIEDAKCRAWCFKSHCHCPADCE